MKKLLMLGTSYLSKEMVEYAKSRGVYTVVTDPHPPEKSIAKLVSDEYWMINVADVDLLEKKCREENINAVICGISEFCLEVSMELCRRLNLPNYCTPEAWHYSRDKVDFKKLCKECDAPVATDYYLTDALTDDELNSVVFPVVVKPVDMSANRGISYCYNKEELIEAYHYAKSLSKSDKIVVERMLYGKEWYSYYVIADGEIHMIGLNSMISEPGELKNLYTLTTTISDNIEKFNTEINDKIENVLRAVGCKEGIAWVQVMLDTDGHFYIIEMGYRLPGDLPFIQYEDKRLLDFNSIEWLVDYALGEKHAPKDLPKVQSHAFTACGCTISMWTNREGTLDRIDGIDQLAGELGVRFYSLTQKGDHFPVHSTVGEMVFVADDCDDYCRKLKIINDTVKVYDTEGNDVLIRYTDFDYLHQLYENGLKGI